MNDKNISLTLTSEEALVLFEFLARYSDSDRLSITDDSEQRLLWNLTCQLERNLVDLFDSDYQDRVQKARDYLKDTI